jgi:hypothetical protein
MLPAKFGSICQAVSCLLFQLNVSYSFWNTKRKVLKFWKFDEKKGNSSKIGNQIFFKIPG